MLIKLKDDRQQWQLDVMKTSQRANLARTKEAKEANSGNGTAYPDGFTVNVTTDEDKIAAFPSQPKRGQTSASTLRLKLKKAKRPAEINCLSAPGVRSNPGL